MPAYVLLESVVGGERFGRYSFIGLPARTLLRCSGFGADAVDAGRHRRPGGGNRPRQSARFHRRVPEALQGGPASGAAALLRRTGRLLRLRHGAPHREKAARKAARRDTLGCPDILLLQCEELAVIDNLSGKLYLIVYADPGQPEAYANGKKRLRELREQLKYSVSAPVIRQTQTFPAEREFAKADYLEAVERAKELIAAGDFMQVQVGQRIKKRYTESPLSLYRALRSLNPSPYMYYYHFGDFHVVGASPEILVRQEQTPEGQKITIRPLAGTRPRAATPEADKAIEQELINDPKERAEHVMLIDLARNDIGRIAKTGTVKVTEAFAVERYSHVMHIVSNVEGILNDGMTSIDVLKATFPAGTLTGAPEGPRDGADRPARTDQAGPVRRRVRLPQLRRRHGRGDRDPHRHHQGPDALRAGRGRRGRRFGARAGMEGNRSQGAGVAARVGTGRGGLGMKLLMIDNYDSFTYNLVQYFGELGAQVEVFRNDEITVEGIAQRKPERLVVSPGPCSPAEAGISVEAIRHFAGKLPILGVCLGHQAVGAAFGGKIVRAQQLMHGKTSVITTTRRRRLSPGCRKQFTVNRYHSLAIEQAVLPGRAGDHGLDRRRRDHGGAPQGAGDRGRAVPSRIDPDRAWPCHAQELPGARQN